MIRNLLSINNKFYEDQAIIFLTFGGFGRYVLYLLYEEFKRLRIPENKVRFLAFDTEQPHRDRIDLEREAEYLMPLEQFDGDIYIENDENKELKKAVSHIPVNLLSDIEAGCKGVPAVGFVAFHKYDDLVITRQAHRVIDDVRAKNPGKKVKLVIISGMGGSVSNGMTIPFLYRVRERLREKKIRVEVFLATSEGYVGLQNVQEDGVERNCAASAMLWEYVMAGRNGLIYPAKKGIRDKRMFNGRVAHRIYIFSGGSAETSLKYQAIASTIATSISTLELTKLGSYLDGDRVNYSAHILEREWAGKNGQTHPTGLLTMNVAGLKADCLPQIFHCYMAKRFLVDLGKQTSYEDSEKIKSHAISTFLENSLNEDDLLNQFKLEIPKLTRQDINQASISQENIHEFLENKIAELQDISTTEFEKKKKNEELSWFVENVVQSFSEKGEEIVLSPDSYLKGAAIYYQKLGSIIDEKLKNVSGNISKVEEELFDGNNQKALSNLLDKLAAATKKKKGLGDIVVKIGESPVIALVNQILDTLFKMQEQKINKYRYLLLQHIYNDLYRYTQEQHDMLKSAVYKCSKMISRLDREIEAIKRIGRSAFTYNKAQFDELTEHLVEKIYYKIDTMSTQELVEKIGLPISNNKAYDEKEYLEDVLNHLRPDLNQLTKFVDESFCDDEKVYDYVKTMLDQFFMTLKLDRDRFPTLETSQASFVMCTNRYYQKYKDDLFEAYSHIETENPFNIIVTKHEEGFPFSAISYMHRINEEFKELRSLNKCAFGHIMVDLDERLPLIDE